MLFSERIKRRVRRYRMPGCWTVDGHFKPSLVLHTRYRCGSPLMNPEDDESKWRCCQLWHRKLHNKWNSRIFAQKHGCTVPDLYWHGQYARDIPFDTLPDSYVVKPIFDSASGKNIYVMVDGYDLMRRKRYSPGELITALHANMGPGKTHRRRRPLLVQEFVTGEGPGQGVSVDYKFHMFADRVAAIRVIKRADNKEKASNFYTSDWEMISNVMHSNQSQDIYREPPEYLGKATEYARNMGAALGTFVRVDFIQGKTGLVFGEMTYTPNINGLTKFAEEYFEKFWQETCPEEF